MTFVPRISLWSPQKTNTRAHTLHRNKPLRFSFSTAEAVQSATLSLQGIDDVQAGDGLALGVFGVGDGVTDDALKEGLEHATGLFVDHCCCCGCLISSLPFEVII